MPLVKVACSKFRCQARVNEEKTKPSKNGLIQASSHNNYYGSVAVKNLVTQNNSSL